MLLSILLVLAVVLMPVIAAFTEDLLSGSGDEDEPESAPA